MEESPYEITLHGHIWTDPDVNNAYYIRRLETLKTKLKDLVISNTCLNKVVYNENIIWMGVSPFLKSSASKAWVAPSLSFWKEFTDDKLDNWCNFMSESLINTTVIAANIFISSKHEMSGERHSIDDLHMRPFLKYSIDRFFDMHHHQISDEKYNIIYSLGLKEFYRLNVLERDRRQVIKISVPCPYNYDSTESFETYISKSVGDYCGLINDSLPNNMILPETVNDGTMPVLSIKRDLIERGLNIWNYLAGPISRDEVLAGVKEPWCKLMNDELITQLCTTGNSVLYIRRLMKNVRLFNVSEIEFVNILKYYLRGTCHNYFCIDCRDVVNLGGRRMVRSENQWSGHWGLKMFFRLNFRRIDPDFFYNLYQERHDHRIPIENPNFTERDENISKCSTQTPYSCTPDDTIRENFLAFLMGTKDKFLVHDFETRAGNPLQTKLDDEIQRMIHREMYLDHTDERPDERPDED